MEIKCFIGLANLRGTRFFLSMREDKSWLSQKLASSSYDENCGNFLGKGFNFFIVVFGNDFFHYLPSCGLSLQARVHLRAARKPQKDIDPPPNDPEARNG